MKKTILVATTNAGKMAELSAMLDANVDWVSLADFPETQEVVEDGETFAENSAKKALGYAKQTGLWTIADDSGLCIDALDGAPGVNSARFSGEKLAGEERGLIDHRNIAKVLELMQDVPFENRGGRFVCHICLASPQEVIAETEGTLEGVIATEKTGDNGFGYDPIMFIPSMDKTAAQLTAEQKNAISHRGNAIAKLKPLLNELLSKNE